jgi:hypothetical protein
MLVHLVSVCDVSPDGLSPCTFRSLRNTDPTRHDLGNPAAVHHERILGWRFHEISTVQSTQPGAVCVRDREPHGEGSLSYAPPVALKVSRWFHPSA